MGNIFFVIVVGNQKFHNPKCCIKLKLFNFSGVEPLHYINERFRYLGIKIPTFANIRKLEKNQRIAYLNSSGSMKTIPTQLLKSLLIPFPMTFTSGRLFCWLWNGTACLKQNLMENPARWDVPYKPPLLQLNIDSISSYKIKKQKSRSGRYDAYLNRWL